MVAWATLLAAVGLAAAILHAPTKDAFNVPGTQAQKALDLLNAKFPARIVFAAPAGHTLDEPRYRRLVAPTVLLAKRVPQAVHSAKAFRASLSFSPDRRIAFADLHFVASVADLRPATKAALVRVARPAQRPAWRSSSPAA